MASIPEANWLAVVGPVYAGFGIVFLASAIVSIARIAGSAPVAQKKASANTAAFATFGAALFIGGIFLQSLAQFFHLPLGGAVVCLLLGLIATFAAFAALDLDDVGTGVVADAQTPSSRNPVISVVATSASARLDQVAS